MKNDIPRAFVAITVDTAGRKETLGVLALSRVPCAGEKIWYDSGILLVREVTHDARTESSTDAGVMCTIFNLDGRTD